MELLNRAGTRLAVADERPPLPDWLPCRFVNDRPSGTSAKFDCVLDGGQVVKVKYNNNPEIQAEAAATRLLRRLGFPADGVDIVPTVRCHGCPRYPFLTLQLLTLASAGHMIGEHGYADRYTDFHRVAVERRFPAPAIETADAEGWAWYELAGSTAPRADVDALRLLAVFLTHWDNKASNQRLVCLDSPTPAGLPGQTCEKPLAMIQDLGATFGPSKVNLDKWRDLPVWANPATCEVTMHNLPYRGATFPDARISEAGRALLAGELARLNEADVRSLFADARFPEYQASTDDDRDLDVWTSAFMERARQIIEAGPCPAAGESTPSQ